MKKTNRLIALGLALVCLLSTAMAADLVWDLNGDGKTTVWDLQTAVNQEKSAQEQAEALAEALGGQDELHPNAEGVYEIHSMLGLHNMVKLSNKGYSFRLMADLDLKNMDWTPIQFHGIFDGNGHTISNVKITKSSYNGSVDTMGFFSTIHRYGSGEETQQSHVKNLHLENVNVTADAKAQYIGLLAGTSKGIIENCTTTGTITDQRTQLPKDTYIGAIVGGNENSTPASKLIKGTDLLTVTAGTENPLDKVEGVSAKLATFFAQLSYPEDAEQKCTRTLGGIAGFSNKANIDTTMLWQDTSNSMIYKSQTEQGYRNTVEQKMYEQGTVAWTPSETIYYLKNDSPTHIHSNAFVAGKTYYGVPYVGGYNGSYERFLSQMQGEKDAEGRYVTVIGLENGTQQNSVYTGSMRYMGSNCSWAVGLAWAAVSPARTVNNYGGVQCNHSDHMVPNAYNIATYGTIPVGGYQYLPSNGEKFPQGGDARDTQSIIALNGGGKAMAEYYAKATKGDAIVYDEYTHDAAADTYTYVNAHMRMIAADPVIIRNYQTEIDLNKSYVITHEQGDGLSDKKDQNGNYIDAYETTYRSDDTTGILPDKYNIKYTSWRINHKYTLAVLLTEEGYNAASDSGDPAQKPGCGWGFVPVTMKAFTVENQKQPYYNFYSEDHEHALALPNKGRIYSNYWNFSMHMTITDEQGNTVYDREAFLMDRKNDGYSTLKLDEEFPDSAEGLTAGQTYYCTLTVLASNGTISTILNNQAFTVSAPATE